MPAHLIVQHMTPRRPPRPPQLKLAGPLSDGLLDPTRWSQSGLPTLSSPTTATLARIQNHEIYAIRLSLLFQKEGPPTAFVRRGNHVGAWHSLVGSDDSLTQDLRDIFTLCRAQALPMRTTQLLHLTHVAGLPTAGHLAPGGLCPVCQANGHHALETVHHRAISCPLNLIIQRAWLHQWSLFSGDTWAGPLPLPV